ncbi:MAG: glycosyltransferase family 4 protein [Candidatus Methanomethylicaceae archaeon]
MRVCFVGHSGGLGGAEKSLLEVLKWLNANGVACYVLLPRSGPTEEALRQLGVVYRVLPYRWWMVEQGTPWWKWLGRRVINLGLLFPICRQLRRWDCDLVVTNTSVVGIGALAARILNLPHVWHLREFGGEAFGLDFDWGERLTFWLMGRLTSTFIANSQVVADEYQRRLPQRPRRVIEVVYQAVSLPQGWKDEEQFWQRGTKGDVRCVIIGALCPRKGQEEAIKAIKELVGRGKRVHLDVVGDGKEAYKRYLTDLVVSGGLSEFVTFWGFQKNPFPYIAAADVVLMCSRYEPFGRVTVEAMKMGKPVIGARSGGTVELIRDGFNGLLYTPGDCIELADKIWYLYEHPEEAQKMGENGKRFAEELCSEDKMEEKMLALLQEAINAHRGA